MLGFSSFSETPFAQAVTSSAALAYITGGSSVTGSVGTFTFNAEAAVTPTGVTATMTADDSTGPQGIGRVDTIASVVGVGSVNLPAGNAQAKGNITLSGTSGTSAVSATTANGKANQTTTGVAATFANGVGFDAQGSLTLTGVSSTITFGDFEDEDAQGRFTLTGVSATGVAAVNSDSNLNGGIYSNNVVYLNTDFNRERCVNIVPYGNRTVYIRKVSNY